MNTRLSRLPIRKIIPVHHAALFPRVVLNTSGISPPPILATMSEKPIRAKRREAMRRIQKPNEAMLLLPKAKIRTHTLTKTIRVSREKISLIFLLVFKSGDIISHLQKKYVKGIRHNLLNRQARGQPRSPRVYMLKKEGDY